MNWRLASRLSVVTLAALVVVVVALWGLRSNRQGSTALPTPTPGTGLVGVELGGTPAPDFTLTDQYGKQVSLAQFRGEPVVLTFLYTHCPVDCPATADKLAVVMRNLGSSAQHVVVLVVSTDPAGDTAASVVRFSQAHHMLNFWHYLTGTQSQLAPVWKSYSVYVSPTPTQVVATAGDIDYTQAIYVIDQQGREQVYFDNAFTPYQLTTDLNLLLKR